MKSLLVLGLFFLVACQSVEIVEVMPEPREPPVIQIPERPEQQPILSQEFTLIEDRENTAIIGGNEISLMLLGINNNRSRIKINETTVVLRENASVSLSGLEWRVIELTENEVTVPRRSYSDAFFNGARANIRVGENRSFGNGSITVDFIGLQDGEPSVRFVVGEESVILQEDGEHQFSDGLVSVRRIFFFDAQTSRKADAVTMSVS